jgi:6-pyruvoyltetrahydropterin/6-carboxytetrahydropterin synthase
MIIRKLFKFENAHIVRNCSTERCSKNIHGHSYKVEILLESKFLDNGDMVLDFGLFKPYIKDIIDSFDHSIIYWKKEDLDYIQFVHKYSQRWIELPFNPSAEQLSKLFFMLCAVILGKTKLNNNEQDVRLHSVIVHETDTGYAQCFLKDITSVSEKVNYYDILEIIRGVFLPEIKFSDQIKNEWSDPLMFDKMLGLDPIVFENKLVELQIKR